MSVSKLTKYINLALNNSSEGESSTAARMFFKKLTSLDMKFNPKTFNLTRAQACRLADLADKVFKGLNDVAEVVAPAKKTEEPGKRKTQAQNGGIIVRACCYNYFDKTDMNDTKDRQSTIDQLVATFGFDKRSVQSYASNYRAGKWR